MHRRHAARFEIETLLSRQTLNHLLICMHDLLAVHFSRTEVKAILVHRVKLQDVHKANRRMTRTRLLAAALRGRRRSAGRVRGGRASLRSARRTSSCGGSRTSELQAYCGRPPPSSPSRCAGLSDLPTRLWAPDATSSRPLCGRTRACPPGHRSPCLSELMKFSFEKHAMNNCYQTNTHDKYGKYHCSQLTAAR